MSRFEAMETESDTSEWMSRLETAPVGRVEMNSLVMDYLITEGYRDAAESFKKEAGVESKVDLDTMAERIKIREAINEGKVDEVTEMINDFDPELLDMKPMLYFHIQQQKLIEFIRENKMEEALTFAQRELAPQGEEHPEILPELERCMALFAFPDPESSPFGDLLKPSHKHLVAGELNAAILESQNEQTTTKLHSIMRILLWAQDQLTQNKIVYPRMEDISSGLINRDT